MIATVAQGLQAFVFRVVIFAKIFHPFIHLTLAAISFTLQRIL